MQLKHDLLYFAHKCTRGRPFGPVHDGFRRIYTGPVLRVLRAGARIFTGISDLEIWARNSALTRGDFNVFYSDLDLGIVTPDAPSAAEIHLISIFFWRAKKCFPFLGELEIYSHKEWCRRQRLLEGEGVLETTIRELRRVFWREDVLAKPTLGRYHRDKALRSLQRCIRKIDPDRNQVAKPVGNITGLTPRLREILLSINVDAPMQFNHYVYSGFLQAWIGTESGDNKREIILPGPLAWQLIAVLPDAEVMLPEQKNLIENLRASPRIREIWKNILESEILLVRTAMRLRGADPLSRHWLGQLENQLHPTGEPLTCAKPVAQCT